MTTLRKVCDCTLREVCDCTLREVCDYIEGGM